MQGECFGNDLVASNTHKKNICDIICFLLLFSWGKHRKQVSDATGVFRRKELTSRVCKFTREGVYYNPAFFIRHIYHYLGAVKGKLIFLVHYTSKTRHSHRRTSSIAAQHERSQHHRKIAIKCVFICELSRKRRQNLAQNMVCYISL